jgi:hypothetical protein
MIMTAPPRTNSRLVGAISPNSLAAHSEIVAAGQDDLRQTARLNRFRPVL